MADSKDIVILLERDKFYLYTDGFILSLNFPPNMYSDLDIKDRDAFFNLVTNFIQANKVEPSQILFVISEVACFSKDFPVKDPNDTSKVDEASQSFVDAVPFNSVLSRIYKTPAFYRVVATNLDLVDTIVDAFTAKGFGLTAVVPANIYPEYGAVRELTVDFAKHIIDTRDKMKMSSMVGQKEASPENHNEISTSTSKDSKSKLLPYLLIGFTVLLIILVVVLVTRK
ncbi:MAG TPA: hypothetical protein VKC53_00240 [Patescibacteria group bacterium]|nr:hypothetical protein [Patescibacteria group bacterium]